MRMLPFFKPKKGFMIAGGGLETSAGGGGGGGSSRNWSTDETVIGYQNNKPVYSKSFNNLTLEGTNVNIVMPSDTINICVDPTRSYKIGTDNGNTVGFGYYASETDKLQGYWRQSDTTFVVRGLGDSAYFGTLFVTLIYQKNTD